MKVRIRQMNEIHSEKLIVQNKLAAFFEALPDEKTRPHETEIVRLIDADNISFLKGTDQNGLIKLLVNIIDNIGGDYSDKVSYSAFFALCTIFRRNLDWTEYKKSIYKYEERFKNQISFGHLKAMYLVEDGFIKDAIVESKKSISGFKDNIGFLHNFAINVAIGFEEEVLKESDANLLNEALAYAEAVIEKDDTYAKFFATYGRLLAVNGNYNEAIYNIRKAIDKERSGRKDYAIRIGDYQVHLIRIKSNRMLNIHQAEISKASAEMENLKIKNLEFLGFFAALVSFTIGSVQILNGQNFNDAASLILILCGSLLLVFGGLGIVLNGKKYYWRSIASWVLGLIIILIAYGIR